MNNMKCRNFNACSRKCQACDIVTNKQCDKEIKFDIPEKFITLGGRDRSTTRNACPTCGNSVGYQPKIKDFRCTKCGQRILWK